MGEQIPAPAHGFSSFFLLPFCLFFFCFLVISVIYKNCLCRSPEALPGFSVVHKLKINCHYLNTSPYKEIQVVAAHAHTRQNAGLVFGTIILFYCHNGPNGCLMWHSAPTCLRIDLSDAGGEHLDTDIDPNSSQGHKGRPTYWVNIGFFGVRWSEMTANV